MRIFSGFTYPAVLSFIVIFKSGKKNPLVQRTNVVCDVGLHKLFGEQLQKARKKRKALRDSQPGNLAYTQ